jgi:hypothetical protein
VTPSLIGIMLSWYFVNALGRSSNIVIRVMILIGTFSIIQFADIYVRVISGSAQLKPDKSLVPNLAFIISIMLYAILRYDPEEPPPPVPWRYLLRRLGLGKFNPGPSYYYSTENGAQAGPFDETEMRRFQRNGTITEDTYIFREGQSDWRPMREFVELFHIS